MQFQEMNFKGNRILSCHVLISGKIWLHFLKKKRNKCITDKPKPCPSLSCTSREKRAWEFPKVRANRS
jgi:hypothetical protein